MQRIYVTGLGVVSPVGNDRVAFWEALKAGRSGIDTLTCIPIENTPITIGGEVRGLDHARANVNDKVAAKKMDKASIFAVVAAGEALEHAGLPRENLGDRVGIVLGSGLSGMSTLQEQTEVLLAKGPRQVSPFTIPILMPNAPAANVSLAYGVTGPTYAVASACSSSGNALIDAYEILQRGAADIVVTGGTEASITRLAICAFCNMKAMTKKFNDQPKKASRPFDAHRDGFVMSEGACILILEHEASVKARGVRPLAQMLGYGMTMDSHHLVQPDPSAQGAIRAIRQALQMARLAPSEIADAAYVNAHGTSTKFNDAAETLALKEIFGDRARRLQISSTKSITGHLVGAAAAIEMAACVLALDEGILPPTINYEFPDPDCDLDYIPNQARPAKVRFTLNNTFGFGGHNVCIVAAGA